MNMSHPRVPALTITSKKAAAKPRRDPKAPRSNSRAIVTFTGQQGFAMRAVRAIPTTCHCGVRAAPGDGICSAATCSGLYLFGWPRQLCGGRVRMRKSRPAGAGLALPRKRRFWHRRRRRRRGMNSSDITSHWLVRIPEKPRNWRMAVAGLGRWMARKRSELVFLGTADQDCLYLDVRRR